MYNYYKRKEAIKIQFYKYLKFLTKFKNKKI